eukprot:10257897-Karenia_brevis.AAC.1
MGANAATSGMVNSIWVAPRDGDPELGGGNGENGESVNACEDAKTSQVEDAMTSHSTDTECETVLALPVPVVRPTSEASTVATAALPVPVVRPTSEAA